MNRLAVLLICVVSAGWASAQQSPRPSNLAQARIDADAALRRESELSASIASQERANALVRQQLRKADSDPAGLQKDLVDASADAAALRRKVAAQKLRYDVASDNLADARARAMQKFEQTESMRSAQRAFDEAAAEMDHLSQPIFEQLERNPDYQQAQALADAAAQTGEALQGFDAVDPKAQAQADAAYDQAIASVRALEDAAIDADPKAAGTHKALQSAQKALSGLRAENEKRIAADPRVDGAKFAFDLEQRLLDESSADLGVAEKRLSALRQGANPAGGATELAGQLKDGEARLHEMSDQLNQARIARRDADQRLRYMEDLAAANNNGDDLPVPLPRADPYPPDYGAYSEPYITYVYPYPQYRYYTYDPYYCPPYYSTGIFFGTTFYSRSHCYPRYFYDRFCNVGYYHNYRDSTWCNRYDYWRGHSGLVDVRIGSGRYGDSRLSYSSRWSNSSSLGRADLTRDSRLMTDYARHASAVERDDRSTRVSTYNYPGSSGWHLREQEATSSRSRQLEDSRDRGVITITRGDGSRRSVEERRVQDDGSAHHAGSSDSSRSSRIEIIRDRTVADSHSEHSASADATSHRARGDDSHSSSSADTGRSRGSDSTARSSSSGDSARSRGSAGSSIGSSGGSSSYSPGPSRGSSPSSGGGSIRGSSGSSGGGSRSGPSSDGGGGGRGRR